MEIKDFARHEFIGLRIKVIDATNEANIGLQGKIVNETKNTIILLSNKKRKMLLKKILLKTFS